MALNNGRYHIRCCSYHFILGIQVYYQDMKMKLESLNDISDRIALFKGMIMNKFNENKEILINT